MELAYPILSQNVSTNYDPKQIFYQGNERVYSGSLMNRCWILLVNDWTSEARQYDSESSAIAHMAKEPETKKRGSSIYCKSSTFPLSKTRTIFFSYF